MALASGESIAVVADHQTAGRGRFGRSWRSQPGASLLLSVSFQPPPELCRPAILTAWAAVAVAEAVEQLAAVEARLKWPNDLFVNGRKVCGILIEQGASTVAGIGLNLNQTREEFDSFGLHLAASLASITGKGFDVRMAAESVVRNLDRDYESLLSDRRLLEAQWRQRLGLIGEEVEIERSDGARIAGQLLESSFDAITIETEAGDSIRLVPETVEHIVKRK